MATITDVTEPHQHYFTADPDAASLNADAQQAESVGLLKPVNLSGIFDLTPLNNLLSAAGQSSVSG